MKKIKKITGITLMVMALAIPAFAWGPGMGPGFGQGPCRNCDKYPCNLTEEQQKKLDELHKAFQDKTADARTEIMKKEIDLNAELSRDKPDIKTAKAIQKDINELQAKISDAHLEFIIEAKKVTPDMPFGKGPKMGRGMRGM
ncbi:MAG: periplasmic heavy metal sensor [Desulfobacteraceae bacterium]|jgi:zinc resistance-associated protein